jgi:hypothetical protein
VARFVPEFSPAINKLGESTATFIPQNPQQ